MQTDGKAARNLLKLQLFRQFYVMVVIYIYFTRIVVYLLRSTMPYQYAWLPDAAGTLNSSAGRLVFVMHNLCFSLLACCWLLDCSEDVEATPRSDICCICSVLKVPVSIEVDNC